MATLGAGNGADFKSTLFICIANGMIHPKKPKGIGNPACHFLKAWNL
jgi:hypothetical protein